MSDMKHSFLVLCAAALAATACTNDELGNGTLPGGARPLVINASGLQAIATPQTRGTLEGNWDGVETVGVRVEIPSLPSKEYKVEAEAAGSGNAHLSPAEPLGAGDMAFWWTSTTETKTVIAWCPYGNGYIPAVWTIPDVQTAENMQTTDLLLARKEGMTLQDCETGTFEFRHTLSKVRINLKMSEYLQSAAKVDVRLLDQYTMASIVTTTLTLYSLSTRNKDITPYQLETPESGCYASYEALVIPLDADEVAATDELIGITVDGAEYVYRLPDDYNGNLFQQGLVYTFNITVDAKGLDVQVSESINWANGSTGSGNITLQDCTYDESTKTYYVYTAEGLKTWAEAANKDLSTNCILMTDIDLSGVNWEPVAFGDIDTYYTGTFDGNGHTISNLTITKENLYFGDDCGMFGRVGTNVTIKNLTLKNVSLNVSADRENAGLGIGALAGANQGTISNCNVSGNISTNSVMQHVGGIVGRMDSGIIQYCHSSASIQGGNSDYVGGVLGGEYATATVIKGCSFSGSVTGGNTVGGIAGYCRFFADMTGCYSVGELSNLSTTAYRTGGVVGFLQFNTTANACYWEGFDGEGVGYCNENNQWDGAYKVDGGTINWAQATQAMNAALGTEAAYYWHTDNEYTPPTLVPNN